MNKNSLLSDNSKRRLGFGVGRVGGRGEAFGAEGVIVRPGYSEHVYCLVKNDVILPTVVSGNLRGTLDTYRFHLLLISTFP